MEKVAVTGSSGFLGRNLLDVLRTHGLTVLELSSRLSGRAGGAARSLATGDGSALLEDLLVEFAPDAVIHLAGLSSPRESVQDPAGHLATTIAITDGVLRACGRVGVRRLITTSSCEVFGPLVAGGSYGAGTRPDPRTPYGAGKVIVENRFRAADGSAVLRCGNLFGPGQQPDRLIPACLAGLRRDDPVDVTANLDVVHDWIHVTDFCRAIHAALTRPALAGVHQVSAGWSATVGDTVRALEALERRRSLRIPHPRSLVDDAAFRRATGWRPTGTFEAALAATVREFPGDGREYPPPSGTQGTGSPGRRHRSPVSRR